MTTPKMKNQQVNLTCENLGGSFGKCSVTLKSIGLFLRGEINALYVPGTISGLIIVTVLGARPADAPDLLWSKTCGVTTGA